MIPRECHRENLCCMGSTRPEEERKEQQRWRRGGEDEDGDDGRGRRDLVKRVDGADLHGDDAGIISRCDAAGRRCHHARASNSPVMRR